MPVGLDPPRITGMSVIDSLLAGNATMIAASLRHMLLPAVTLASVPLALITRITRAEVLAAATLDHVRTARAKGVAGCAGDPAPHPAQCGDPDRHGDRPAAWPAAVGRGADRDDLFAARPGTADGRFDPVARLSGGAGGRAVHRCAVRAGEPAWSICCTPRSIRGSAGHERHRCRVAAVPPAWCAVHCAGRRARRSGHRRGVPGADGFAPLVAPYDPYRPGPVERAVAALGRCTGSAPISMAATR